MEAGAINDKRQPMPVEKQPAGDELVTNGEAFEVVEVGTRAQHAGMDQTCEASEGKLDASPTSQLSASPSPGVKVPAASPQTPRQTPTPRCVGGEPPHSAGTPAHATDEGIGPQAASSPASLGTPARSIKQTPSPRDADGELPDSVQTPVNAIDEAVAPQDVSRAVSLGTAVAEGSPVLSTETLPSASEPPCTSEPTEEDAGTKTAEAPAVVPTKRSKASCC